MKKKSTSFLTSGAMWMLYIAGGFVGLAAATHYLLLPMLQSGLADRIKTLYAAGQGEHVTSALQPIWNNSDSAGQAAIDDAYTMAGVKRPW